MGESVDPHHARVGPWPGPQRGTVHEGVRGWLLVLCVMLVVVGPIVSLWLMAHEYEHAAAPGAGPLAVQVSAFATLLLSACAVAFGAYAGLRLWLVRPNAVSTARQALLFGLAVDVVTTTIQAATAPDSHGRLLLQVELGLIPGLIFFTLCLAYLNRSTRVAATYGHQVPADR